MKLIRVDVMYRDACNYKNSDWEYFTNKKNIPLEEIQQAFEPIMDNPIMVQDYGIESIAPLDSEFDPMTNEDDHAYCEILEVEEEALEQQPEKDISLVLDLIEKGGDAEAEASRKQASILMLENHLLALKK